MAVGASQYSLPLWPWLERMRAKVLGLFVDQGTVANRSALHVAHSSAIGVLSELRPRRADQLSPLLILAGRDARRGFAVASENGKKQRPPAAPSVSHESVIGG